MDKDEIITEFLDYEDGVWNKKTEADDFFCDVFIDSLDINEAEDILMASPDTHSFYFRVSSSLRNKKYTIKKKEELSNKPFLKNESVSVLLEWYNNKKSKKVTVAKKKLCKRFLYLAYNEQLAIMFAFLNGTKTDREWCFKTLKDWWSDELKHDLLSIWQEFKEERCGWILTRYLSVEELREHLDSLIYASNYYALCKRLVGEDWFTVDRALLKDNTTLAKYLWILSQTKEGVTEAEGVSLVYEQLAQCINYLYKSDFLSCGRVSCEVEIDGKYVPIFYNLDESFIHSSSPKGVRIMLTNLCKLSYYDAVRKILKWDEAVYQSFLHKNWKDLQRNRKEENKDVWKELAIAYLNSYADQFPKEYVYLLDLNPVTMDENTCPDCNRNEPSVYEIGECPF